METQFQKNYNLLVIKLGAYVTEAGKIVIPYPYYSKDKKDYIHTVSYNLNEFNKHEALKDFILNYGGRVAKRYL